MNFEKFLIIGEKTGWTPSIQSRSWNINDNNKLVKSQSKLCPKMIKKYQKQLTFKTLTASGGYCINAVLVTLLYIRSTNIPARMACATERNLGFSSLFFQLEACCRVNVEASHSRTSGGTASGWTSDNSSSSSTSLL